MTRPVFLITLGAIAGACVGVLDSGGDYGREFVGSVWEDVAPYLRSAPTARPVPSEVAESVDSHAVFSACVRKSGTKMETVLRDLLEFHDHDATVKLVDCLLGGEPRRFCGPDGRQQAADAMEIYLWSREDAHRTSPAHGLADKIRKLEKTADTGVAPETADPFLLSWSGPRDRAIFDRLRDLATQGYLDPGAFAYSGRAELREALRDVKVEASPCNDVANR